MKMSTYAKTNVVSVSRELPVMTEASGLDFLYIPVNSMGMAVEPKRAIRLECWKHTGVRREILYVCDSLKYALTRKEDDAHVHLLSRSFIHKSNEQIEWLTQIHRHVAGDIHMPKFQFIKSPSLGNAS